MPPDQHRSTLCDDVACRGGEWADVQWSPDGADARVRLHLARPQARAAARRRRRHRRGARRARRERAATFFESGNGRVNWRYLPASNEVIWFSERDNWGQLYLYDLRDRQAEEPDHHRRLATSRSCCAWTRRTACSISSAWAGRRGAIRTSVTSTASGSTAANLTLLTPEDAQSRGHARRRRAATSSTATRSPTCRRSRCCATPTASWSRTLEKADISKLLATGWKPPHADHGEGARRRRPISTA